MQKDNSSPFFESKDIAVLLIDMQDGYLDFEKRKIIPNQISIIKSCKEHNIPLVVLEVGGEGITIPELEEEIKKLSDVYRRTKKSEDAFKSTDIDNILRGRGIKKLILMGVNACVCVFATARGAVENGYEIITSNSIISGFCSECENGKNGYENNWYMSNGHYLQNHIPQIKKRVEIMT